ncbi:hypothetical protein SLEP1_g17041 [Rubroshorea leprosula]|uniref:Uncharacterized protein n=1 Tax=Rubroshorea leprosula TaxID=152421 RepID=A0AAV5IYR2_9ROSI|nr:hypothetical protein SLEP1_g17041 [Rubroshorea leprosula]
MRIRNYPLLFLMLIIMLGSVQFSGCREIKEATIGEEAAGRLRNKYAPIFSRSISTILGLARSSSSGSHKIRSMHTVSRRIVPCGPNPLHN